ncbi:NAD(P)H-dependent glycerol-3-phosphate dehydrogenase [Amphritea pacifica]|uniref:Glycerol-3-phosphate dehydrogenase [NAD(P)+] n=1 Tax=Amphritea pacifica TaxID=2811233 RepID=A0ABS2W398_9GAMM|nr:NAD(P)H-dependent glycerol-3-phosphate dehydrogenase [Amphritea pacifica]MBN0986184.1 NAD(P)H-dependent glycerol-3-phosphate dehydrogenase [Amphritea pacifica]MBN1008761.1 NAD(P)H-dependent glycerol-3-phosphate dehydrogenase [Amphritea pacifica]
MTDRVKVAVLGGGSFGTVIANLIGSKGEQVHLWMRNAERAEEINRSHENHRYLPGRPLSENLTATADLQRALQDAEIVFVSIPSQSFREVIRQAKPFLRADQIVVSTTKGIEAKSFSLMSQILSEELPGNPIGVISGPNLAKEIVQQQLTATVIASEDERVRTAVQQILHCAFFRVYASSDMYGVELGGTLKNIYAIASGLSAALGMGENTKSMLMTRSLAEMSRFAVQLGANPMTFLGLAGVGDLIVTCSSPLSRNYRVGYALGEGKTLEDAVESLGEVAEGVNTLRYVKEKADELEIYMPLVSGLYEVVFNHAPVSQVAKMMMLNTQSSDVEFVLPRADL